MKRESPWRNALSRIEPDGIPWPASVLYDLVSRTRVFQSHYELVVEDMAGLSGVRRLLDIGTGPGWLLLAVRRSAGNVELAGVDISDAMVARARKNLARAGCPAEIRKADAACLPYEDDYFDIVTSTGSLHHWKAPEASLGEIFRVLKPGGKALLYDLVRKLPEDVSRDMRRKFGTIRAALYWLHSLEEPFYDSDEMKRLAGISLFREGEIRFVGGLCCLEMRKPADKPGSG